MTETQRHQAQDRNRHDAPPVVGPRVKRNDRIRNRQQGRPAVDREHIGRQGHCATVVATRQHVDRQRGAGTGGRQVAAQGGPAIGRLEPDQNRNPGHRRQHADDLHGSRRLPQDHRRPQRHQRRRPVHQRQGVRRRRRLRRQREQQEVRVERRPEDGRAPLAKVRQRGPGNPGQPERHERRQSQPPQRHFRGAHRRGQTRKRRSQ